MSNNHSQNRQAPQPPAAQNRDSRTLESRDADAREETWAPPETLPEVIKKPGMAYRWTRTAYNGTEDPLNMSRAIREKWEPVPLNEQPQMAPFNDPRAIQKGSIEIGGLLLMYCPDKFMKQRDAYYQGRTRQEQEAVDQNLMNEQDPRMPLYRSHKSRVTFGQGGA